MQEHASSSHSSRSVESASYSTRRFYKRNEGPRRWWPWGLLPLLLLGLLFLYGVFGIAPDMQEETRANVASLLRTAGYTDMDVVADGQQITIKGTADVSESAFIERIAKGTGCDTFFASDLVCPTTVSVELNEVEMARNFDFSFVRSGDGVILRGEVPGPEVHTALLDEARAAFGTVVDSLRIAGEGEDARYRWAFDKAFSLLAGVNAGRATWQEGVLSLVARTVQENERGIREQFTSARFPERFGSLELQFEDEVEACNVQLENALAETLILFETASAVISGESIAQLSTIANIANSCPGNLVVEGHTDSIGDDESNQNLSQRRANAVVAALTQQGVNAGRLSAVGYGETRPLESNDTAAGRAMNRRIVIRVADFN